MAAIHEHIETARHKRSIMTRQLASKKKAKVSDDLDDQLMVRFVAKDCVVGGIK